MQAVTLATAVLGAVLGILNWWRNFNADRVRLRVGVGRALVTWDPSPYVTVSVVNLSGFSVTITSMGFDLIGTTDHMQIHGHWVVDGGPLPKRLEPRTAITAFVPVGALQSLSHAPRRAYVNTACGCRRVSGTAGLRKL